MSFLKSIISFLLRYKTFKHPLFGLLVDQYQEGVYYGTHKFQFQTEPVEIYFPQECIAQASHHNACAEELERRYEALLPDILNAIVGAYNKHVHGAMATAEQFRGRVVIESVFPPKNYADNDWQLAYNCELFDDYYIMVFLDKWEVVESSVID